MKAYEIQNYGSIDALAMVERPEPRPGPGQVLIRMRATSLNYRDLLVLEGAYSRNLKLPLVPMSDGAGEVVEMGEGVARFKKGDRVAGVFFQNWISGALTREKMTSALGGESDGMLVEYAVLDQEGVVRLPDHLSYEEGATLPCSAVTAWHGLVAKGGLIAGESVLLLGTGGVSIFALQFAKLHGARTIITSSSDAKLERARELGASETINYKKTPDWDVRVRELTEGQGADLVIEVGGGGTLAKSIRATRVGGRISLIGVLTGKDALINPLPILFYSLSVQGIFVGSREMFEAMSRAITAHRLRPVIDRVFSFAQAREAYQYMKSAAHFGKIVIKF
jgi:NADPH:quinone reductase-like Zn-dependent oxidoreductase